MTLSLYDTMSRSKRPFVPRNETRVTMYVCGPTVYNFAHIGNFRPVVVFDLLFRVLRDLYGPDAVLYAANVTDVDDKINRKAVDEGVPIATISNRYLDAYNADAAALGALPPTFQPRVTETMDAIVRFIGDLALAQKESLVRRLVFDSPAEQRIAASGNEAARAELARARTLHARAVALAESGDLAGAQAELNAAMWAVGKARQLAPDPAARAVDQRVRYAGLLRTVETLARSYEASAARLGAAGVDPRLAAARASQEQASGLAATEHMEEAVKALERAERELMAGLNAMLGSSTLQYAKRYETPAEEHAYELERNRSYRELVPIAIAELKPRREAVVLVDRYVAANARQLEAAEGHAAAGRLPEAIDALRTGTNSLQAALSAAGLAVPRNIGAN